jgi:hypothetical protein
MHGTSLIFLSQLHCTDDRGEMSSSTFLFILNITMLYMHRASTKSSESTVHPHVIRWRKRSENDRKLGTPNPNVFSGIHTGERQIVITVLPIKLVCSIVMRWKKSHIALTSSVTRAGRNPAIPVKPSRPGPDQPVASIIIARPTRDHAVTHEMSTETKSKIKN